MQRPEPASTPYEMIEAVNALRSSYGLAPYSINATLMAVAQAHADYMALTKNVSHTGVGGSSVTDRLLSAGYPLAGDLSLGGFRSENITSGAEGKTAQDAVMGWTGDTLHLTTMISPDLTEIGAGVSINEGRVYYVIDCALPTNSGLPQQSPGTVAAGAPTLASAGSVIFPVVVATPNGDGDVFHDVKAGQSLWQIAISYETKIDEIKRLNNLYDDNIYPGSRLLIREGIIVSAATPVVATMAAVLSTPTDHPTTAATQGFQTVTASPVKTPVTTSTNSVMGIAIGILALALLGGGLFVRLGASKKIDS